jgi:hypothetical protein
LVLIALMIQCEELPRLWPLERTRVANTSLIPLTCLSTKKVKFALAAGCHPVRRRDAGAAEANQSEALLDRQLGLGLTNVQSDTLRRVSIVYGPVWADR